MKTLDPKISQEVMLALLRDKELDALITPELLRETIDRELSKDPVEIDNELVNDCVEMLLEMQGVNLDAFDDEIAHSQERSMQAIHSRIARIEEKRYWKKFIPRVLVTAAALTVMFLVTNLILSSQGIRMFQGKDQEQYVVQGQDRDDPMRVWAGGAEDGETQMVTFANIEEVQNAFVPRLWVPTWLPEGMELSVARGVRNPVFTEITLPYADTLSREVIVNATRYQNARQAGSTYEQNEEGHTIILTNGTKAYIATNMDVDWAFVTMQDTLYQVVCIGFDEPTLIRILNSIAERDSS